MHPDILFYSFPEDQPLSEEHILRLRMAARELGITQIVLCPRPREEVERGIADAKRFKARFTREDADVSPVAGADAPPPVGRGAP